MGVKLLTRPLVSFAVVAGVVGAILATSGTSVATSSAEAPTAATVSTSDVSTQAVVNLGLDRRQAKAVQRWLASFHGYNGAIDGVVGTGTNKALQRKLRTWGYSGPIDGIAGAGTKAAFARFAQGLLCEPCTAS